MFVNLNHSSKPSFIYFLLLLNSNITYHVFPTLLPPVLQNTLSIVNFIWVFLGHSSRWVQFVREHLSFLCLGISFRPFFNTGPFSSFSDSCCLFDDSLLLLLPPPPQSFHTVSYKLVSAWLLELLHMQLFPLYFSTLSKLNQHSIFHTHKLIKYTSTHTRTHTHTHTPRRP